MAMIEWMIKGYEVANCNCNTGCPCQFMSPPTNGNCRAAVAVHIDEGHHGKVKLDGLNVAMTCAWPGAVHQGHGEMQYIIEERASKEQREALHRILRGEDTEPAASAFKVYSSMCETIHSPIFKKIEIKSDRNTCESRVSIPDVMDMSTTAIRNPVTGDPHHAKIVQRHGFEYIEAESAKGDCHSPGPIALDFKGSHAHLAAIHVTGRGLVR